MDYDFWSEAERIDGKCICNSNSPYDGVVEGISLILIFYFYNLNFKIKRNSKFFESWNSRKQNGHGITILWTRLRMH